MKIIIAITILKSFQIKGTLSMDYTDSHITWSFSFDSVTYLSHLATELILQKSIYYFAFPDYLVLRTLAEKTIPYLFILERSLLLSHQLCSETGMISISYPLVFRKSWSSIRNLSTRRQNVFEKNDQF